MELRDAAFDLVESVECFTDADEACANVDVAIMVGGFPRKSGMERLRMSWEECGHLQGAGGGVGEQSEKRREDCRCREPGKHERENFGQVCTLAFRKLTSRVSAVGS